MNVKVTTLRNAAKFPLQFLTLDSKQNNSLTVHVPNKAIKGKRV